MPLLFFSVCNRLSLMFIIYCSGTNSCPMWGNTGTRAALYTAVKENFGGVLAFLKVFMAKINIYLLITRFDINAL